MIPTKKRERRTPKCLKYGSSPRSQDRARRRCRLQLTAECLPTPLISSTPIYPLTSRIQCSECGSFYRRRIVSGTVKWVCSLHKDDSTACDSNYYNEERIYDGFISLVNKLRFSEDNILGQVISRLEMTLAAMKRNNLAARDLSKSIAELNAKLLMLEQLRSKGYLAPEVYQAQANEISAELAKLKDVRQGHDHEYALQRAILRRCDSAKIRHR